MFKRQIFAPGQIVVCVDNRPTRPRSRCRALKVGAIYRVIATKVSKKGQPLVGVAQGPLALRGAWFSWRFRPLGRADPEFVRMLREMGRTVVREEQTGFVTHPSLRA